MTFSFSKDFFKQLKKANNAGLNKAVLKLTEELPHVENITDLTGIKKLRGHSEAYRLRLGKYRLGFYLEEQNHIFFAAVAKREIFYRSFPK